MTSRTPPLVLFLIDGLRPDAIAASRTPALDAFLATGAHTLTARTVMPSMTLPCHMSLFTGVRPSRHGITTNVWTPPVRPVPGLFDVLNDAGRTTAFFYNWEELRDIARPGALDASFMVKNTAVDGAADTAVAHLAATWLGSHSFDFAFVYLGCTDIAGHAFGWMSDPYLAAVAHADRCIGHVRDALPDDCTVLVMSDHGGHDQTHGTDLDEDMTIPVIAAGQTVTGPRHLQDNVKITDIAPTIVRHFAVTLPREWIGRPIDL